MSSPPIFNVVSNYVQGFPVIPPCYGNGVWLMTQNNSATYQYSLGGKVWQTLNWPMGARDWAKLLYINGLFLAIPGLNNPANGYWWSVDGINWNARAFPLNGFWYYCSNVTNGVAILKSTNDLSFMWSTDGLNWNSSTTSLGEGHTPIGAAYGNGLFHIFYNTGQYQESSPDLVTWNSVFNNASFEVVPWFGNGVFVAGGGVLSWSADGVNFTNCVDQNGAALTATDNLCYDAILGQFVCVPYPDGRLYTSDDGKTFKVSTVIPYPGAGSYRMVPSQTRPQTFVSATGSGVNFGLLAAVNGSHFSAMNFSKIIQVQQ